MEARTKANLGNRIEAIPARLESASPKTARRTLQFPSVTWDDAGANAVPSGVRRVRGGRCRVPRGRVRRIFGTKSIEIGPECQSRARKVGNLAIRPPGMTERAIRMMTQVRTDGSRCRTGRGDYTTPFPDSRRTVDGHSARAEGVADGEQATAEAAEAQAAEREEVAEVTVSAASEPRPKA